MALALSGLSCNAILGLEKPSERAASAGSAGFETGGDAGRSSIGGRASGGASLDDDETGGSAVSTPEGEGGTAGDGEAEAGDAGRASAAAGGDSSTGGVNSAGAGGDVSTGGDHSAAAGGDASTAGRGGSAGSFHGETGGVVHPTQAGAAGREPAEAGAGGGPGGAPQSFGGAGGPGMGGISGAAGGGGAAGGDPGTGGFADPCPGGCTIAGECVEDGTLSPDNPCQECDFAASPTSWSDVSGTSCDDEIPCNGADACLDGQCVHAGSPCAAGVLCRESDGLCCTPNASLACGDDGNVHHLDACGTLGTVATACPGDCVDASCRCIVYVSTGGNDGSNGRTWGSAKRSLQAAMDTAAGLGGCEVWVRAGRYTAGTTRESVFSLRSGVAVFGGFAGNETRRLQRDIVTNTTTLSGDVPLTPTPDAPADDAYHVILGADDAILDGFTITQGNANGAAGSGLDRGGGMLNSAVSPTVRSCTFINNRALVNGGGMCNIDASPRIEDSVFDANRATSSSGGEGAGMFSQGGAPVVVNTTFQNHSLGRGSGGAFATEASSPTLTGCTFSANSARDGGGAVFLGPGSAPVFSRCHFTDNASSESGGGALETAAASPFIIDSEFTGNTGFPGGAIDMVGGSPFIVSSLFADNRSADSAGGRGGAIHGDASAPTIVNSLFFGNSAAAGTSDGGFGGAIAMERGGATIVGCTFYRNTAVAPDSEGGAVFMDGDSLSTIHASIFFENSAALGPDVYRSNGAPVSYSVVRPPYNCTVPDTCVEVDPGFVDPAAGDYTPLNPACIDSADAAALPQDLSDLDADGDVEESVPYDMAGTARIKGIGLDMGALEAQ